jgi:hypothetical protein
MSSLKSIIQLKRERLEKTTLDQSKETSSDIPEPVFVRFSVPGADQVQKSLPEFLQGSWSKYLGDPKGHSSQLTTFFKAFYLQDYSGNKEKVSFLSSLNLSLIPGMGTEIKANPLQVSLFFGAFKNNESMKDLKDLLDTFLDQEYNTHIINGENSVSHSTSEEKVKKYIAIAKEENKKVILLSRDMGSRSFSVSEIDTVFLGFDKGDLGVVSQKVSRPLTPGLTFNGEVKTHGLIVSLSFDANRTTLDPISTYFLDQARRIGGSEGIQPSLRRLAKAMNIFVNRGMEIEILSEDDFMEEIFSGGKLEKIFPNLFNENKITEIAESLEGEFDLLNDISDLRSSDSKRDGNKVSMDISKTKKYFDKKARNSSDKEEKAVSMREILIKAVVAVGQRIPNAFLFSIEGGNNPSTINEIFSFINSSEIKKEEFLDEMEIPVEVFEMVFNEKLLSDSLANTIIAKLKSDREKKIEQKDSILYSDDLESIKKFLGVSI